MNHSKKIFRPTKAATVRTLLAGMLAAVCLFGFVSPASAARLCLPHGDIAKLLNARFSEARVAAGVASGGGLVEIFSTTDGATWTIVVTSPQGMSCVVSAGEGWHSRKALVLGPQA